MTHDLGVGCSSPENARVVKFSRARGDSSYFLTLSNDAGPGASLRHGLPTVEAHGPQPPCLCRRARDSARGRLGGFGARAATTRRNRSSPGCERLISRRTKGSSSGSTASRKRPETRCPRPATRGAAPSAAPPPPATPRPGRSAVAPPPAGAGRRRRTAAGSSSCVSGRASGGPPAFRAGLHSMQRDVSGVEVQHDALGRLGVRLEELLEQHPVQRHRLRRAGPALEPAQRRRAHQLGVPPGLRLQRRVAPRPGSAPCAGAFPRAVARRRSR